LGAEPPSVKSVPVDGSKATAAVAGIAAGIGLDKIVKKPDANANTNAKPAEVKPEESLPGLGAQPHVDLPKPVELPKKPEVLAGSAALVAEKSSDAPISGAVREPVSSLNKNAVPDTMKTEPANVQAGGTATHAGLPEAKADWPTIPNGRGRVLRSIAGSSASGGSQALAAAAGVGGGMAIASLGNRNDRATAASFDPSQGSSGSEIAPIKHLVQSGENFWTISRDYYGSGRYYKALWSANRNQVAKIDQLHVGDTIRIPAMEYLDKSLIETPGVAKSKRQGSGNGDENPPEVARSLDNRAVRTGNDIESRPTEQEPPASKPKASKLPAAEEPVNDKEIVSQPLGETASKSSAPRHRVQPGETLRTIARDRLGDARRGDEIVALNADILESTRSPIIPGQVLKLPAGSKDD
jgi:nucleoid-associated protein YgaU